MGLSKQIKTGALISYLAIFVNIVAMLVYTPWMKNQIGVADYGLYTLANSFITLFLMDFGIGASVSRFLAKYRAEENIEACNNLLGLVYKLFLLIDIVIFAVLLFAFFFLENIYAGLTPQEIGKFKVLYVIISSFSLFSFPFTTLNGIFNAYEKFIQIKLCDLFQKLLSILLIVIALINHSDVIIIVTVNALSGLISIFIKLYLVRKTTPVRVNFKFFDKTMVKAVLSFSVWTTILGIAQRLIYNIAPTILGIVSNTTEIAIFSPASSIAGYFFTFAVAINGLFLPSISRKVAQEKEEEIFPLMLNVGRFQVVVLCLLFVGFATVGKEFMILWMGEEFTPAYYCVLVLTLPTIFEYSQQIANTTILAKNKVKLQAISLSLSSLLNIILSPFLSNAYGALGTSIAILIAAMFHWGFMNVIYYKVLNLNVFQFYKKCYLPMILPLAGSLILSRLVTFFISLHGWVAILIKSGITLIIFGIFFFFLYATHAERKVIWGKIKKFTRRKTQ